MGKRIVDEIKADRRANNLLSFQTLRRDTSRKNAFYARAPLCEIDEPKPGRKPVADVHVVSMVQESKPHTFTSVYCAVKYKSSLGREHIAAKFKVSTKSWPPQWSHGQLCRDTIANIPEWLTSLHCSFLALRTAHKLVASPLSHNFNNLTQDQPVAASDGCKMLHPVKAPLDERDYGILTLENALRVVLVSDMEAHTAAACMTVGVGYFNDPPEIPGLAHFLEHMLFLGTEKYPDEGSYFEFVSDHGGDANAFTAPESTSYHFYVATERSHVLDFQSDNGGFNPFPEALDRFAQFFVSPLFTESATSREVHAVESEHSKNLQSDLHRISHAEKARQNPAHPISRFGSGSRSTLLDIPKQRNVNIRSALFDFHAKYYSANRMSLCIAGPFTLNQLKALAVKTFGAIRNNSIPCPQDEYATIPPVRERDLRQTLFVDTVRDVREVSISWYVPCPKSYYKTKPCSYITSVLEHEGRGSLISRLKYLDWANYLVARTESASKHYNIVRVCVGLTPQGVDQIDNIVHEVFAFLRLIRKRGIKRWIHDEEAGQDEIAWRFGELRDMYGTAKTLSNRICCDIYSDNYILKGPFLSSFDTHAIAEVLRSLTPLKMNLQIAGHFVAGKAHNSERWYGTKYALEYIDTRKLARWQRAGLWNTNKLSIRVPNPLLAENFDVIAESTVDNPSSQLCCSLAGPSKIKDTDEIEVHHMLDRKFRRPTGSVSMILRTPVAYESPAASVLASLFAELVIDGMAEYGYDAMLAGLSFDLSTSSEGVLMNASGYTDKLACVVEKLIDEMTAFKLVPKRFYTMLDQYKRGWRNCSKNQAEYHASSRSILLLHSRFWSVSDYQKAFSSGLITEEALAKFVPRLLEKCQVTALVYGNLSQEWALRTCSYVEAHLGFSTLPKNEIPTYRIVQLPAGVEVVSCFRSPNVEDENSAVHVLFQIGVTTLSYHTDVVLEILADIVYTRFFEQLRTKQQSGYIVRSGIEIFGNVQFLSFTVQGADIGPEEMRSRINKFLHEFRRNTLEKLTETELSKFVHSQISQKQQLDRTSHSQKRRIFSEIASREYNYHRSQFEIEELQSVSRKDLIEFYDKYIAVDGQSYRRLSIHVHGRLHALGDDKYAKWAETQKTIRIVKDALEFKLSCELLPSIHGVCQAFETKCLTRASDAKGMTTCS